MKHDLKNLSREALADALEHELEEAGYEPLWTTNKETNMIKEHTTENEETFAYPIIVWELQGIDIHLNYLELLELTDVDAPDETYLARKVELAGYDGKSSTQLEGMAFVKNGMVSLAVFDGEHTHWLDPVAFPETT